MTLLIGFLTFILVVNCLFLILLVLIQLPKKEAGAGIAFGGGTTDALFGAGSGNALTKLTKYSAALFLGLALFLTVLNSQRRKSSGQRLEQELQRQANAAASVTPAPLLSSNQFVTIPPKAQATNPAAPMASTTTTQAPPVFTVRTDTTPSATKVATNAVRMNTNAGAVK